MADLLSPDTMKKLFREHGLRFTSQRYAIYHALATSHEHPTAENLHSIVKQTYHTLSMNTVYNTLEALKVIGIASDISLWHDKARFDANLRPHHHLVCIQCRRITDLIDPSLDRLTLAPSTRHNYELVGHRVEIQGICKECRTASKKRKSLKNSRPDHSNEKAAYKQTGRRDQAWQKNH